MEKNIIIDGKEIKLKANAMNALIYRSAFGEDIFKAQSMLFTAKDKKGNIDISKIDSLGMIKIVWTMAKAANDDTAPFEEWLSSFEEFPVLDLLGEIVDLILVNMTSKTKIKNQ